MGSVEPRSGAAPLFISAENSPLRGVQERVDAICYSSGTKPQRGYNKL
jgi:hypothetical protein